MDFYVYVIQSEKDQRLYFGQTTNVSQRLEKHNKGYSIYTKYFRPWVLFSYKKANSRTEAISLERKLKNLKSKKKVLEFLENHEFIQVKNNKDFMLDF
jgi:putative endonuclease